jgi:hypothetical protein
MPLPTLPDLDHRLAFRLKPAQSNVMHQTWSHLLFLHWEWDPAEIQRRLPPGLHVDTHEGKAWLGIVPFYMRNIRPRYLPAVPWVSHFLEMNLRTYVHDDTGQPGVWFFSLDCNQPVAVWTARKFFHLPYQHAAMSARRSPEETIRYRSLRRGTSLPCEFTYHLADETRLAEPGSLDFFLAERYLLFAQSPGGLRTGQVHHLPYPLAEAEVTQWDDHLLTLEGFKSPGRPPDHVIGSPGVDVLVYPLTPPAGKHLPGAV